MLEGRNIVINKQRHKKCVGEGQEKRGQERRFKKPYNLIF